VNITEFFLMLYDQYGINLSIFYDDYDQEVFLRGLWHTGWLSIVSILVSVAIGAVGAGIQFSRSTIGIKLVDFYVQVFRNTPPLIQLYFFYFALGPTVTDMVGSSTPVLSNISWAIVSLSLYAGAFNVEIFRAGIEAVPASTLEAADALGLKRSQLFSRIVLPLAARISMPAMTNNLVNLIKTTTNAFAIAVPELLYASSQIWSEQTNTFEMMIVLLLFYCLTIGVFVMLMSHWERKIAVPGWGKT
jgi:polar amino acid transport system permease protein